MISNFRTPSVKAAGFAALILVSASAAPALADIEFRHALDDSPLDLAPIKGEEITDAVTAFRKDGVNPYNGNAEAITAGQTLFDDNCQACHGADGTGGMGPSLVDEVFVNTRANTDVGVFEIIHSGASGAMRSVSERGVTQDQMLKIIAYIHSLKK
ncbi:c-type cytochrome [Hyphomicrobium sp.]|uniref:c-type cytochrome n=1 Tax=Hyphomicrobium sp. TaxID=82 RepID=UPI0025BF11F2|nr:c-type cytochrome [Hyphomicrobium sp.]MCC7250280.1 c-type cytochrome [Hyphomicrobium sp.]